jgi:hypothetical protein
LFQALPADSDTTWFLLYRGWLGGRGCGALALFSATRLPLVVVIVAAAVRAGEMSTATASALVGAGMVTVVVFPLAALRLLDTEAGAVLPQEGSQPSTSSSCAGESVRHDGGQTLTEGRRDAQPL